MHKEVPLQESGDGTLRSRKCSKPPWGSFKSTTLRRMEVSTKYWSSDIVVVATSLSYAVATFVVAWKIVGP